MKLSKNEQIFINEPLILNGKQPYYYECVKNDNKKFKSYYQKNENNNEIFKHSKKNQINSYILSKKNSLITQTEEYSLNLGNIKDFNNHKLNSIKKKNEEKQINFENKKKKSIIKSILKKNKNFSLSYSKKLKKEKSVKFNFSERKNEYKEMKENFPLKISKNLSEKFLPKIITEKFNKCRLTNNLRKYSNINSSLENFIKIPSRKILGNSSKKNLNNTLVVKLKGRSYEKNDIFFKINKDQKKLYDEIKMELDKIEYSINIKKKLINEKIEKIEDIRFKLYK